MMYIILKYIQEIEENMNKVAVRRIDSLGRIVIPKKF